jgi:hypothetical protein
MEMGIAINNHKFIKEDKEDKEDKKDKEINDI